MKVFIFAAAFALCMATQAMAQVRITEWAYQGADGEFIEFTNLGPGAVDMTGWSYDDDGRVPGAQSLSAFNILAPGESAILADILAADFITAWGLPGSVKVIGGNVNNLSRNDEINIFNGPDPVLNLVDRFAYGDQNFPGTIRTQNKTGNPVALSDLETDSVGTSNWVLAVNGDSYGSYISVNGDVGNPGIFSLYVPAVPEPTSLALAGLCAIGFAIRRR